MNWTKEEILILRENYSITSKEKMIEKLATKSWDGIRKKAKRMGIEAFKEQYPIRGNSKGILKDVLKYKAMYDNGDSILDIIKHTHVSHKTMTKIFKKANVNIKDKSNAHRKYSLNESFFDSIDTEEKAYFLGFIYADGFIYLKKNFLIGIEIHQKDIELLHLFKQAVSSQSPIKLCNYEDRTSAKIRLFSKHMTEELIKKGVTERKSLILRFPTPDMVPNHLLHHFMRGYFDGDGSIKRNKNQKRSIQVEIVSSNDFCMGYMKKLNELASVNIIKMQHPGGEHYSTFTYCGRNVVKNIYNFLYKDSTLFLKRKYDRFTKYFAYFE